VKEVDMKYMLMLFEPDTDWTAVPPDKAQAALAEHGEFCAWLRERGIPYSGEPLREAGTATTLRPVGDELVVTDGPFAELRENLGGFYVVDVRDLDEAIEVARRCPTASGTEIRPIWEV
jgi:hypothetical protein